MTQLHRYLLQWTRRLRYDLGQSRVLRSEVESGRRFLCRCFRPSIPVWTHQLKSTGGLGDRAVLEKDGALSAAAMALIPALATAQEEAGTATGHPLPGSSTFSAP